MAQSTERLNRETSNHRETNARGFIYVFIFFQILSFTLTAPERIALVKTRSKIFYFVFGFHRRCYILQRVRRLLLSAPAAS